MIPTEGQQEIKQQERGRGNIWDILNRFNTFILATLLGICSFFIVRWINQIDVSRVAIAADLSIYKEKVNADTTLIKERLAQQEVKIDNVTELTKNANSKLDYLIGLRINQDIKNSYKD